jgi:hypothetical protein
MLSKAAARPAQRPPTHPLRRARGGEIRAFNGWVAVVVEYFAKKKSRLWLNP